MSWNLWLMFLKICFASFFSPIPFNITNLFLINHSYFQISIFAEEWKELSCSFKLRFCQQSSGQSGATGCDWAAAGFGREDLLRRADGTLPRSSELCLHRIVIMQRQSMIARDDRSNVFADALSKISFVHENKCLWKPMFMETNVYESQCLWKGQMFTNADAIRSALFMGNNEIHMLGPFWFS